MRRWVIPAAAMILAAAISASAEPYAWPLPAWMPSPPVPADNPMSAAKVDLGRHLFHDARLSRDGTVACTRRSRASIAAPGKWGWMFGGLTPDAVPDLVAFIHLWLADTEGLVPKDKRRTALRIAIPGRMPPPDSGARFVAPDEAQDHQNPVQQGGTQ